MIYGLSGYFKREKTKKNRLFLVTLPCAMGLAHGKVTTIRRVPGGGTRRTDQSLPCAAGPGTRQRALAHGEGRGLPCAYRVTHGEVLVGGPGGSILRRVPGPAAHGKG